jgi:two-component system sensor histidine kinase RegB
MHSNEPSQASNHHNLKRMAYLRSLVILGEVVALLAIRSFTNLQPPILPLFGIIGLMAAVNIWTWQRARGDTEIKDAELFFQLIFDVFALTGVLYFTGGATNPFAWFFLIPLMIAATVLSQWVTWLMAALTTACYSLLMFKFLPLSGQAHMHHDSGFSQHVFGMWFGFVLSAVLVAWFIVGMAQSLRERDRALASARERALRDEQLIALGTLATGAAHELGTPLATMAIVTGELKRSYNLPDPVQDKLQILQSQVLRCKEALSVISASAGTAQAEGGNVVPVSVFIEQVISLWKGQRIDRELTTSLQPHHAKAQILNERTLQQSIINLLNNAADASPDNLQLNAAWDTNQLTIEILDRGPGLHPENTQAFDQQQNSNKEHGMGLGLFLTHATIQRLGGDIELIDRVDGGNCTRIRLPLIVM